LGINEHKNLKSSCLRGKRHRNNEEHKCGEVSWRTLHVRKVPDAPISGYYYSPTI
jgi:hypothetical protein